MTLGSSITTEGTTKQWNHDSTMPKKIPTVYSILKLSITCQGSLKDIFLMQAPNTFTPIEFLLKGLLEDDFCLKREQTKKRRWWEIHNRKDTTQERSEKSLQNSGGWRSQGDDCTPDVDIPGPMWHRKQTWWGLSPHVLCGDAIFNLIKLLEDMLQTKWVNQESWKAYQKTENQTLD